VPADQKAEARKIITTFPFESPVKVAQCVRINALTTREGILDLAAIAESATKPEVVILPKATSAIELSVVAAAFGDEVSVIAIIESTAGLNAIHEIAAHPLSKALLFGSADFSAEIGSTMEWDALLYARSTVVAAAATYGKSALDGIWPDIQDNNGLIDNTRRLKAIGFSGRVAIHPSQIEGIKAGFTPTAGELHFAQEVVRAFESAGGRAIQVNGKMVDQPIYDMAIYLLEQYSKRL
jgi:citrate lyase beta subunit